MVAEVAPAVPQAEPAVPVPEAQPPVVVTDQPFGIETTETTPAPPTETQEPAPPEPAAPPKPALDDLSDDDLANTDRVKNLIARQAESQRQRLDRERVESEAGLRRQYAASEQFVQDFEGAIRESAGNIDADGRVQIDRPKVDRMFLSMLSAGAEASVATVRTMLEQDVPADFVATADERALLTAAYHEYNRDPVRNSGGLVRQWVRMRDRAVIETQTAAAREEGRKAGVKEAESRFEEQTARDTREATRDQAAPAAASGVPANGAWGSQLQVDTAHANGQITTQQKQALYRSGVYTALPPY